MDNERFTLRWDRPFLPDAATHVSLFDGGTDPLHIVASGHGTDDASALRDLWRTLRERRESAEAIAYVTEEYSTLSGNPTPRSR
jgi:hypothetical protein